ncbi:MAG: ankyrin repeat domain-containing protein [Gammaproteobacteria bacterium]
MVHHAILSLGSTARPIISYLIEAGSDVNASNLNGQTPLLLAAEIGLWKGSKIRKYDDLFSFLLRRQANPKLADARGFTLLHYAASQNNTIVVKELIDLDCFVDQVNIDGVTPLHIAAMFNHVAIFKLLVKHQSNIELQAYPSFALKTKISNRDAQMNALGFAFDMGNPAIINECITLYIKNNQIEKLRDIKTANGETLLHYFVAQGDLKCVLKLLKVGCCPLVQDNQGYSSIHAAVSTGNLKILRELVNSFERDKSKLNLELLTHEGKTAWMLANELNQSDIAKYLRSKGSKRIIETEIRDQVTSNAISFIQQQIQFRETH